MKSSFSTCDKLQFRLTVRERGSSRGERVRNRIIRASSLHILFYFYFEQCPASLLLFCGVKFMHKFDIVEKRKVSAFHGPTELDSVCNSENALAALFRVWQKNSETEILDLTFLLTVYGNLCFFSLFRSLLFINCTKKRL